MLWERGQGKRKHPAPGTGEGMPGGGSDVSKRARAVNPSETVVDAGNFAVGARAAAVWGTVRGCWGEVWAMDAEPVLVLLLPCLPLASGRNAAGKLFFLHQTERADVFACPNLTARCAAKALPHPRNTAVVCCLCPTHFPSSSWGPWVTKAPELGLVSLRGSPGGGRGARRFLCCRSIDAPLPSCSA